MHEHSMQKILDIVKEFNIIIRSAVEGPNCIDPMICDGNCCFIQIDIPKILANYYIEKNLASIHDFLRGDVFAFEIRADLQKLKCIFFDKNLNGCKIHQTGMKPPQCWVYPTGLDPENMKPNCKKAEGWKIINPENARKAKLLLDEYVELCKSEAIQENSPDMLIMRLDHLFLNNAISIAPSNISGIEDGWDSFRILSSEGVSLALKPLCQWTHCNNNYLECKALCPEIKNEILQFLKKTIPLYIKLNGFKREYSFIDLKHLTLS